MISGYLHPQYAESLAEFGVPTELPSSQGWILVRDIAGTEERDAMGCYPLFSCRNWADLCQDVELLGPDLVSLTLVTDPLGDYQLDDLKACFPNLVRPFKEHFIIDLHEPRERTVSKNHRYYARKALRELTVEVVDDPESFIDEWTVLHGHLVNKHDISGIRAFSHHAFLTQFRIPGVVTLRAMYGQRTVAAMMFCVQDDVAHAHVLGCSPEGYARGALYAIIWHTFDFFDDSVRWCNLMGVPDGSGPQIENIRRFKRGWTRDTRTAYLCGRVLNRDKYDKLAALCTAGNIPHFPIYRAGALL